MPLRAWTWGGTGPLVYATGIQRAVAEWLISGRVVADSLLAGRCRPRARCGGAGVRIRPLCSKMLPTTYGGVGSPFCGSPLLGMLTGSLVTLFVYGSLFWYRCRPQNSPPLLPQISGPGLRRSQRHCPTPGPSKRMPRNPPPAPPPTVSPRLPLPALPSPSSQSHGFGISNWRRLRLFQQVHVGNRSGMWASITNDLNVKNKSARTVRTGSLQTSCRAHRQLSTTHQRDCLKGGRLRLRNSL